MSSQEATVYLQTNLVVSERKMTINLKMRSAADVESAIQFLQHPHSKNCGISIQFLDPLDGPAAFLTNANFNSLLDELANFSVAVTELFVENAGSLFQHNTIDQRTLDRFCNIVGAKRDLAELTFHDASPSGFFSVAILAKILAKSKGSNLKKVWCCGRFGGTTEDLTALASALANHSTLQNVRLLFKLIPETLQTVANINPIVVALGTIPNLTTLGLTTWAPPPSPDDRNAANHLAISAGRDWCAIRAWSVCLWAMKLLGWLTLWPLYPAPQAFVVCMSVVQCARMSSNNSPNWYVRIGPSVHLRLFLSPPSNHPSHCLKPLDRIAQSMI